MPNLTLMCRPEDMKSLLMKLKQLEEIQGAYSMTAKDHSSIRNVSCRQTYCIPQKAQTPQPNRYWCFKSFLLWYASFIWTIDQHISQGYAEQAFPVWKNWIMYFLIPCIHSLVKITGSWGESVIICSPKLFKSLFYCEKSL